MMQVTATLRKLEFACSSRVRTHLDMPPLKSRLLLYSHYVIVQITQCPLCAEEFQWPSWPFLLQSPFLIRVFHVYVHNSTMCMSIYVSPMSLCVYHAKKAVCFPLYTICFPSCTKHYPLCTKCFTLHTKHFTLHAKHYPLCTKHFQLHTKLLPHVLY